MTGRQARSGTFRSYAGPVELKKRDVCPTRASGNYTVWSLWSQRDLAQFKTVAPEGERSAKQVRTSSFYGAKSTRAQPPRCLITLGKSLRNSLVLKQPGTLDEMFPCGGIEPQFSRLKVALLALSVPAESMGSSKSSRRALLSSPARPVSAITPTLTLTTVIRVRDFLDQSSWDAVKVV